MTDPDATRGELGDLPGLEGRPTRELVEGWTDDDWAAWFREEVIGTPSWETLASTFDPQYGFGEDLLPEKEFARDIRTGDVDEGLRLVAVKIGLAARDSHPEDALMPPYTPPSELGAEITTDPTESFDFFFSRLSTEVKLRFFEGWYRVQEDVSTDDPAAAAPAPEEATTTEPHPIAGSYIGDEDSIVPELAGPPTPDPFGLPPKEPEPVTGTEVSFPRLSPTVMAIGGALALALVLILVFTLLGSDDTPTATEEAPAAEQPAEPEGAEPAAEPEGIEFQTSFGPATYFGPTSFAAGEAVEVTIEYRDANGDPITGATLYFSLISSDDEAHFETVTDENGLAVFKGPGPTTAGTYQVLASDGGEPWEITVVEIT